MENQNIPNEAKIRVILLYVLRYERMQNNAIKSLVDLMDSVGISEKYSTVIHIYIFIIKKGKINKLIMIH